MKLLCSLIFSMSFLVSTGARGVPLEAERSIVYALGENRCAFTLAAHVNGSTIIYESAGFYGFAEKNTAAHEGLFIRFQCTTENDPNYCTNSWLQEVITESPSTRKIMKIRFYEHVNPIYNAMAYAASTSATPTPRSRSIRFCMNHGIKTLESYVYIGDERKSHLMRAINILKTIRMN